MSLITWCPLIEDTVDKIQSISLTGDYTIESFGKIGSCVALNQNKLNFSCNEALKNLSTFSIAFWVYYDDSVAPAAWADIFGLQVNNGSRSQDLRMEVTSANGTGIGFFCNDVLTNPGGTGQGFTLSKNTWTHIVLLKNNTNITVCVNGQYLTTYNFIDKGFVDAIATGQFHLGDSTIAARFNDLRIYDHELSALEIKHLSQALVMHYDFNNTGLEATLNYSIPTEWSFYTSYYSLLETTDSGFIFQQTPGTTTATVAISNATIYNQMEVGDTWTASCYLYKNSKPFKATSNIFTNWAFTQTVLHSECRDDGYFTYTFTITEKKTSYLIHAPFFGALNTITESDIFEIKYLQFEKKDHATAYTHGNRAQSILNNTGNYHCVDSKNICLTQDSATGQCALKCNGTWIKTMVDTTGHADVTLAAWVKPSLFNNGVDKNCIIIGGVYLTISSTGKISTYSYGKSKAGYHNSAATLPLNEWSHIAAVWDESAQEHRIYFNGQLDTTITECYGNNDDSSHHSYKCIGYENGSTRPYTGLIDDTRIYTTALSDDDIRDLYETKAYLTQEGMFGACEFIETTENLFSEEGFKEKAKSTSGNGALELRNGSLAFGLKASTFWYGEDATSYTIFQDKIKPDTQYYFDCWIDADTMWYDKGGIYVPAGLTIRYTDGSREFIRATSSGGNSGWQHVTYYTDETKSVFGIGIYYYIGTQFYLRADSYMVEVNKNNGIAITEQSVARIQQLNEINYNENILYHDAGSIAASEIIEI